MIRALYLLFVLSGAAGLIYESIWTRYLGLFVGHDAYAQIIVLVIFLGGMSVGALVVEPTVRAARPSRSTGTWPSSSRSGVIGLFFHEIFQAVTAWAYAVRLSRRSPAPGRSPLAKWGIAGALILPQSMLLGVTFPLMTAGVLRLPDERPGRTLSMLYFSNSLGAAVGVLVAGFYLVALAGLPGTLLTAAMLNLVVAVATIVVIARRREASAIAARPARLDGAIGGPPPSSRDRANSRAGLERLLLCTSFGTAVASFIYEIAWIRMLALVLGSATHSFELMLSAFILGLALGRLVDPVARRPARRPAAHARHGAVGDGLPRRWRRCRSTCSRSGGSPRCSRRLRRNDAGYPGFTIARYGLCLVDHAAGHVLRRA